MWAQNITIYSTRWDSDIHSFEVIIGQLQIPSTLLVSLRFYFCVLQPSSDDINLLSPHPCNTTSLPILDLAAIIAKSVKFVELSVH
jgi:hypothetical protein